MGAFDDLLPAAPKPAGAFDDLVPTPRAAASVGAFDDLIPASSPAAAEPTDSAWEKIKGAPIKFAVGTAEGLQNVAANIGEGVAQLSDPGPLKNNFGNFLRAQNEALKQPDVSNFNPVKNTTTESDQLARAMGKMELQREAQREQARNPGESFSQAAREVADQLSFVKDVTPGPKIAGEVGKTAGETAGMIAPSAFPVVGPVAGAAAAGLASTGGTFNEAYKVYLDAGLSEDDAREKARDIAAKTGGTTALLFALPVGKLASMPKTAVSRLMLSAGIGSAQMGADTFQSLLKAQSTYNPNLTLADIAKVTGKTAAFGALLSGAMHGVGELGRPGEQPGAGGEQVQPAQPSAEDLSGLQQALTQNQIKPAAGQPAPPAQRATAPLPGNRVHEAIQEMLQPPAEPVQTAKADQIGPEQAPKAAKTAAEPPEQPTAVNEADSLIDASLKRGDISQGEALVMKAQVRVNAAKMPSEKTSVANDLDQGSASMPRSQRPAVSNEAEAERLTNKAQATVAEGTPAGSSSKHLQSESVDIPPDADTLTEPEYLLLRYALDVAAQEHEGRYENERLALEGSGVITNEVLKPAQRKKVAGLLGKLSKDQELMEEASSDEITPETVRSLIGKFNSGRALVTDPDLVEQFLKGKANQAMSRPVKLPDEIRYTIRPNGKYDIAAQTSGEGTLGLENNLSYDQLVAKVGKPIADLVVGHAGDQRSEDSGFKSGVLRTKDLSQKLRVTRPAEGETTESAAPETQTGGTAPEVAGTPGTPAEKAAPPADGGTIPVEGGGSPSRSAAGSFSPFKVGDKLEHDGQVKTVTRVSFNPKYVVLDGKMVSVGETRPVTQPAESAPARRAKLSYTNNRPHDLIDEIEGQHGTIDPALIKEANPNWKPTGAARKIFKKGGTPADVAADDLSRSGLYKGDPAKVDQFGDAVNDAAQARKGFRATAAREQKQTTQDAAFARDVSRPGVDQRTIISDDLQPGDELKIRGAPFKVRKFEFDDDGNVKSVTMDDGAKYGTQEVKGGTEIKYDNRSLRKSDEPIVNRRTPEGTTEQRVAGEGQPGEPRSRDKTVEFLNSLKVDTKGQVHAFGLAPAVWNTLVDGVIMGVRGGRKIAEAVSWAIDQLKEKYPAVQFDEAGAREHFEKTPAGNLRYESPEGKEVAPVDQMKARRAEIDQRLAEIHPEAAKAQKAFSKLSPDLRSERFQLNAERRQITKRLLEDPGYVRELILANESKGAEYQAAKADGNLGRAREIAEEALPGAGDVKTELERVAPELHDQVRKQLEGEGLVKAAPATEPGRTLGDLTSWLNKNNLDSPKLTLAERLSLSKRLTDTWEKSKDLATRAFHQTMASWEAFKAQYKGPPVDDDVRSLRKDWLAMKQRTGMEVQHWLDAIDSKVKRPDRQMALSIYLDAGRDENLLRAQLDEVPEKWKSVWKAALGLNPKEKELAAQLAVEFSKKLSDGQLVGIIDRGREDYGVPQLWKKNKPPKWETPYDPADPQFKKQGAPRNLRGSILDTRDPFFALKRKVPSYFDGIMAGGEPESLKIRDLVGVYNAQFHDALADRGYVWAARNAKMPDGDPVVYLSGGVKTEPGVDGSRRYFVDSGWREKDAVTKDNRPYMAVDHPALKGWKFASKDAEGNPIMVHGDFMVHPDAFDQLTNDLGKSALRNPNIVGKPAAAVFKFLLNSTVFMKASKFAAATFHGATLAEHLMTHAFAGKPSMDRLSLLNPSVKGVEIDPGKNPDLALLMRNGTYMGFDGQRHLFEEGLASNGGVLEHVPYLGDVLKGSTKFVFEYYLPRLKAKLGQVLLDANRERYSKASMSGPALSDDQIAEVTSNQLNAAFGGQHWRLMGTNKMMLDVNRILFTAPDFLLSRAKVLGQALKPYNVEQRLFLVAQAALVYTAARTLNALFSKDHNPHWEPAMWDKVVIGNRAYSGRFLVSDISNAIQDPVNFGAGRIGPWPKTAIDAFVQRDWRTGARMDVPFKTDNRALRAVQIMAKDASSWMIPVGAEGFLPGAPVREQSKGSQIAQALAGVGSRKYTAETQMYDAATKFNKSSPDAKTQAYQKERDDRAQAEGAYRRLTDLLDAGRLDDARNEYKDLLAGGKTPANVAAHFQGVYRAFTGNQNRETAFKASLSPKDLAAYNEAIQLRLARRTKFNQIRQGVAAPAAAAGAD